MANEFLLIIILIYSLLKVQRLISTGSSALEYYMNHHFIFKAGNYNAAFAKLNEVDKQIFYDRSTVNTYINQYIIRSIFTWLLFWSFPFYIKQNEQTFVWYAWFDWFLTDEYWKVFVCGLNWQQNLSSKRKTWKYSKGTSILQASMVFGCIDEIVALLLDFKESLVLFWYYHSLATDCTDWDSKSQ